MKEFIQIYLEPVLLIMMTCLVLASIFLKRKWLDTAANLSIPIVFIYLTGYRLGVEDYPGAVRAFVFFLVMAVFWAWLFRKDAKNNSEKTYTRKDLVRAQEIYYENYLEDPESYKPIPTKGGAAFHMDYLLGIIDQNRPKLKEKTTLKE